MHHPLYFPFCNNTVLTSLGTLVAFPFQICVSHVILKEQYKMFIVLTVIRDQEFHYKQRYHGV